MTDIPNKTSAGSSKERLGVIKQTPRQASIDDIEWLCEEVERLRELFAATKVELAKYERNPASMLPVRFRLADIIDFLELRCVGVDQSADAARWEVIRHFRSQRLPDETRPTRDVEHCDYPDYERHWTAVVAQARELLEPLAEHDPEIRKWLRTAGLPPAQETRLHPRHWHCDTHGDFDAMVAVGCPECMRAARVVLRKIAADELTRTEMRIAAQEIVRPASPMSDTPNTQKASARQVGCEDANRLLRIHTETCDVCRTEKASEPLPCEHLRSERLATKSSPDGEPLFEMRKCLDCMKIFRVRLAQNGE